MSLNITSEFFDFVIRIMAAAFMGGLIGLERDIHGRAAGLRTHLLVSVGSCLFMIISWVIASRGVSPWLSGSENFDPGRIAAQVVTGIGFLGAGTIIKEGFTIRGLTTAACLWVAAGIGLASGAGLYGLAMVVTAVSMITLLFVEYLEKGMKKDSYRFLTVVLDEKSNVSELINYIQEREIDILYFDYCRQYDKKSITVKLSVRLSHKGMTDKLAHGIIADLEKTNLNLISVDWQHRY